MASRIWSSGNGWHKLFVAIGLVTCITAWTAASSPPPFTASLALRRLPDLNAGHQAYEASGFSQTQAEVAMSGAVAAVYYQRDGKFLMLCDDHLEGVRRAASRFVRLDSSASPLVVALKPTGSMTPEQFLAEIQRQRAEAASGQATPYIAKFPCRAPVQPVQHSGTQPPQMVRKAVESGVVFSENFETGLSNWNLWDNTFGAYTWSTTNCDAHTGSYCADAVRGGSMGSTLGCNDTYPQGITTDMQDKGCENLTGAQQAWLDGYVSIDTDDSSVYPNVDALELLYSANGSGYGWIYWGLWPSWWHIILNLRQWPVLGDLTQYSCNQLWLEFNSQYNTPPGFGARIDDITIQTWAAPGLGCSITANPLSGPAPLTVAFSSNLTGASGSQSYYWNFGDGSTDTSPNPVHTYASPGDYYPLLNVKDGQQSCSSGVHILVQQSSCNVVLSPATIPSATVGTSYNQAITASGGVSPYTFAVTSGSLPTGLALSSAGLLSGTPTLVGTSNFTVTATDASGCSGSYVYTLAVGNGGGNTWISNGPPGSAWAIAVDHQNPSVVYVGTDQGGLYKSMDAGTNWQLWTGPSTEDIHAITIDPSNHAIIYAGSAWGSLYKSGDQGTSWTILGTGLPGPYDEINVIAMDPTDDQVLYLGFSSAGVYKSIDGGQTWASYNAGLTNGYFTQNIYSIAINPVVTSTLYAASATGVYKSIDGGSHWNSASAGLPANSITVSLAMDPNNPSILYCSTWSGIYKSMDGAATWAPCNGTLQVVCSPYRLKIGPETPNSLYAGSNGCGVYQSADGGLTWADLSGNRSGTNFTVMDLAIGLSNPLTLFAATPLGVYSMTESAPGCALTCTASAPGVGPVNAPISFQATATPSAECTGTPSYSWNFGDGGTSAQQNPTHTYATANTYNWTMTTSLPGGTSCQHSGTILVQQSSCNVVLSPATIPSATVGTSYNQAITASGGVSPYTFAITAGGLPPGLALSTDGIISGTPTAAGTYTFSITATDANGCNGSQPYTCVVANGTSPGGCMQVGQAQVCADTFTDSTGGWTAQGHVKINGFLQTDGALTYNSTTQSLSGNDGLYVQTSSILGKITIFPATFTLQTANLTFIDFSDCDQSWCQFNLAGLPVTITDATLSTTELSITAKMDVSKVLEGINELVLQLHVDATGVQLGECLGVSNATIPGTQFQIPDAQLCYTPASDTWDASIEIHIPLLMQDGEKIEAGLQVAQGCLNQVSISGSGLNIPIFGGTATLDSLGAELGNLCQGGYPYFKGTCGITAGPDILGYSLLSADPIDVTIDTQPSLTVDGQLKLVVFPVSNGTFKLGPGPIFSGDLTAAIPAEALPIILFQGNMDGGLNPNWHFQATGTSTLQIPSTVPLIGGISLAQQAAHIDQNGVYAQGEVGMCPFCTSICAHVDWNGNFSDQCWTQEVSQSIRSLNTGIESAVTLILSQATAQAFFGLQWQQGDLDFTLLSPSGRTYTPTSGDALYIKNPAGPSAFYVINDPEQGVWTLTIPGGQYGTVTTDLLINRNLAAPTLTSPAQDTSVASGNILPVGWTMNNPQPDGAIELFLSPTYPPTQSQLLATVQANQLSGSSVVTVPPLTPGVYYLYGIYNDSAAMPRYSLAPGRIVIQNTTAPPAPYILGITQSAASVTLQWQSIQQGNIQGYDIYWTASPFAGSFANKLGIGGESSSYTISGLIPGHSYEIGVSAFDATGLNGPISHMPFTLNEPGQNQPQIISSPPATAVAGVPYSYALKVQNLDSVPLVYSIGAGPSEMSVSSSGVVQWTPQPSNVGQVHVQVQVAREDSSATVGDAQTYTLSVASPNLQHLPPQILSSPVLSVLPGVAYRYACTAQDPQGEDVAWSLLQAPPGMAIDSQGVLTWPQTASYAGQSVHVVISASDTDNLSATQEYWLKVGTTNCPTIALSPSSLAGGSAGAAYAQTLTATGGTAPYTFAATSGSLPTGLALSTGGVLSGTPTATGTFNFTITATDANGCTGSQSYTLTIGCPAITVAPASIPSGMAGVAYPSMVFTQTGGMGTIMWRENGMLPTGMSFSSGTLAGTPTQTGSFPIAVTATDSNGCTGSQSYTLTIACPVVTLAPATLPGGSAGAAYAQTLTATGGTAPYTFAATSGSLPTGLSLTTGGVLSGTPTATGTFNFTITATDANGCTGSHAYAVSVLAPPVISLIKKVAPPFKIVVTGSNLQNGIKVYINGAQWGSVVWKNAGKIQLTGGASLKLALPKNTPTQLRFVNPDGGEVTTTWGW